MVFSKSNGSIASSTWNVRFREFKEKLARGNLSEIAEVVRDLHELKRTKGLSFVEKRIMEQAKDFLVGEISASTKRETHDVGTRIDRSLVH